MSDKPSLTGIINAAQNAIDLAYDSGFRAGIEAAARVCEAQRDKMIAQHEYCLVADECAKAIRALNIEPRKT